MKRILGDVADYGNQLQDSGGTAPCLWPGDDGRPHEPRPYKCGSFEEGIGASVGLAILALLAFGGAALFVVYAAILIIVTLAS